MSSYRIALFPSLALILALSPNPLLAEGSSTNTPTPGDRMFAAYFEAEAAKIASACHWGIHSPEDWKARRPELQREAAEMLGLDPPPERGALNPVVTGTVDGDTFTVEKLYFQSRSHLYVTANLYVPKHLSKPAPTLLYLCGHTPVITNGVSYGNKTAYQHHGIWFARNGYVCLVLDTLQWGEILGHHHGTYSEGAWWWNSRGYTPAGVETWNAMRAIDYLVTRPEVDKDRIGVTGRSGGGAYSWFVAALDDRVKVAAPVAGITDLRNYVVDGTVDHHCDCMFFVNTYRWDYPLIAALCAPRPLLLVNTDADPLFPLDGVMRTRNAVKRIYDLYGTGKNFGLVIAPGPHKDTQDVQVPVFHWFNAWLKQEDSPVEPTAKLFAPSQLKVFDKIPDDQINTTIQDSFVAAAPPPKVPETAEAWRQMKEGWMRALREKCFAGWPADSSPAPLTPVFSKSSDGVEYDVYDIKSEPTVTLRLYVVRKSGHRRPHEIYLRIGDASAFSTQGSGDSIVSVESVKSVFGELAANVKRENVAYAVFMPRGIGATACSGGVAGETHLRRRFMLLGQTLDSMRVWDIRWAVQALHSASDFRRARIELDAQGQMGVNALYASLFELGIDSLDVRHLPNSQAEGPDYLNVLKYLDIPQAAAMAAERSKTRLQFENPDGLDFLKTMSDSPVAKLKLELIK